MTVLKTLRVKDPKKPGHFKIINEIDFDQSVDELLDKEPQADKPSAASSSVASATKLIKGKRKPALSPRPARAGNNEDDI